MLKTIFIIIGTLIGAGFASGREIYLFFLRYGKIGILGILLTGILLSIIIYRVLVIVKTYEINNYNKLLERINWRHSKLNRLINIIVDSFLLVSFYIMIAGFSSYIKQRYDVPIHISSMFFVFLCYLTFRNSIDGIAKVNKILVPILILLITYLGIKNIPYSIENLHFANKIATSNNWIISSILYASYNSIILIPVLASISSYITNKKQIIKISITSGIIIVILALLIYGLLLNDTYFISQLEMPLLEISIKFGKLFEYIYCFVIISSIFTSAISTGFSFLKNTCKTKKMHEFVLSIICISGVFISNMGFSILIENLYPLFGILGITQFFLLLKKTS